MLDWLKDQKDAAPFIASMAALIAAFLGPMIQQRLGHRQQRASVVSSNRIRWIEEFRREIAEFCALCELYEAEKSYLERVVRDGDEKLTEHYWRKTDETFLRVNTLMHSIRMKLDLDVRAEREIFEVMQRIDGLAIENFRDGAGETDMDAFRAALMPEIERLRARTRRMLRYEWAKVERLE
jgi:hypothetical protein